MYYTNRAFHKSRFGSLDVSPPHSNVPVHKLPTILTNVGDIAYNRYMSNKLSNMINIEFTVEEARAYADALNRATDNPFIQDDDDCSPLFTLLGLIEEKIDTVLDPIK